MFPIFKLHLYDKDQFRNNIFIYTKNVERVRLYYEKYMYV